MVKPVTRRKMLVGTASAGAAAWLLPTARGVVPTNATESRHFLKPIHAHDIRRIDEAAITQ